MRIMKRRTLSRREFVRAGLVGVAGATGIGSLHGAVPARRAWAADPVKGPIAFWSRETFNNGARQPLLREQAAAFDKRNPGATTSVQFMPFQESIAKTQAALAAGTPPDVGQQGPDVGTQFAAAGNLLDLTAVAAELKSDLVPLQRDAYVTWQGKTYGIPWWSETRVLFYHKDLLDKAGVKPPTTWAEWVETANKLTSGEQYGFAFPAESTFPGQLWVPLGISNGGRILDRSGTVVSSSAPMREALQYVTDFYTKHKTMPAATPTYKRTDVHQLFILKKIAMLVDNGEVLQTMEQTNPGMLKTVGAVTVPVNKAGDVSRSFLGGFTLFVFAKSANQPGALAFLRSLYEKEWYTRYLVNTNGAALPVVQAAAGADFYRTNELLRTMVTQLSTAVRYGGPDYGNTPWTGEAEGKLLFSQPVVEVINGKKSVDQALADMTAALKTLAKQ
jgi:ABC-type glycerol-3-phosphate transport system substrate-binding protein